MTFYGVLLATMLCWLTYSGPYKWLAEWQMSSFGKYYPAINIVVMSVSFYGIAYWSQRLWHLWKPAAVQAPDPIDRYLAKEEQRKTSQRPEDRLNNATTPRPLGCLLLFGLMGLVFGAASFTRAFMAGDLTQISVDEIESGSRSASGWVEFSNGTLLMEAAISLVESDGPRVTSEEFYVPVVSEQWRPRQPVFIFLFARSKDTLNTVASDESFRGLTTFAHLPGEVRTAFDNSSYPPAENVHVLNYGDSPERAMSNGWFFTKAGAVLLAVFCPCYLIWRRRLAA